MTTKSPDDLECERIMHMSLRDLFGYVMEHPEYLTDRYYRVFGNAISKRYSELSDEYEMAISRGKAISK